MLLIRKKTSEALGSDAGTTIDVTRSAANREYVNLCFLGAYLGAPSTHNLAHHALSF